MADDFVEKAHKTHIFYLHETVGQSYARDIGTVATFLILWSLGHFAGSAALEWVGVLLGMIVVFSRLISLVKRTAKNRMTPDEARVWLDENFPKDQS